MIFIMLFLSLLLLSLVLLNDYLRRERQRVLFLGSRHALPRLSTRTYGQVRMLYDFTGEDASAPPPALFLSYDKEA